MLSIRITGTFCAEGQRDSVRGLLCRPEPPNLFDAVEMVADKHLDREKWTGKYLLPDGRAVARGEVVVPDGRFFEWGNSDLEIKLLLEWGLIRKQMEPLFYQIDDSKLF